MYVKGCLPVSCWLITFLGHYHAHTTGKVLHRDLSEHNLMFDQEGNIIRGVLNDWDMALLLDGVDDVPVSTVRHRTGTIPFMAIDLLLQPIPPTHLYRHDLESFFYILVWAAMNYDLGRKERCAVQEDIACWDSDLTRSGQSKDTFIMNIDMSTRMLAHVKPGFEEVTKEWIQPLLDLFRLGRTTCIYPRMALTQPYDHTTYGGHVTFHSFMEALGRTPRHHPNGQAVKI